MRVQVIEITCENETCTVISVGNAGSYQAMAASALYDWLRIGYISVTALGRSGLQSIITSVLI